MLSIANELAQNYSDWAQFTLALIATDTTMNLGFYADGMANTLGGFLDNVSLVPEPTAITLFILGLIGITFVNRKRSVI